MDSLCQLIFFEAEVLKSIKEMMTSFSYFRLLLQHFVTGALELGKQFCQKLSEQTVKCSGMDRKVLATGFFFALISYTEKVSYSTSS